MEPSTKPIAINEMLSVMAMQEGTTALFGIDALLILKHTAVPFLSNFSIFHTLIIGLIPFSSS